MKTFIPNKDQVDRNWHLIDASEFRLGRLATEVATRLRGKNKAIFTPHLDVGDYVIVINSDKVKVSGNKKDDKMYHKPTSYIGNLKSTSLGERLKSDSTGVIEDAVSGMLPSNKLRSGMLKRLRVFTDEKHGFTDKKINKIERNGK
jgi:large subunit ribosomal protein L13